MSHTVHPYSHRLGIIRDWKSRWFSSNRLYRDSLRGDLVIREFLQKELRSFYLGGLDIERNQKVLRVIIKTSRPGMLIGKAGDGAVKLHAKIAVLLRKNKVELAGQELKVDIEEIRNPESNAAIAAMMVAEALEKRLPFRRVLKQSIEKIMANKAILGARIRLAGRLGGAEIARTEELKKGRIPLQTLRADIEFVRERAHMAYGDIGIKVWIYKGEIFKNEK
ncbi:MAG: 30S ribosomal protein S3 [Candidatus Taylorbacteria bacterium RIFCSPLOWO2_01_FULL_44_26]|uniref:Small ribosomal subunit protein uS3 n=2 Tax=Candidatus Tayloriibacteriota TaxID=1817919 RepID=A0A1G2MKV4_9BACT|nr:MAG: 30S ribosomal protein S3 [Candidatus Taylorbacteria bacterium RIFCSPHIGHO2_02_FULL_44_12]OHA31106.1 MAG: 30S ribosomal protein S3 [Candidatus Taylorbacteria bacterium RIFCSPLOWO2_01_FULL_44_26]